MQVPDDLPTPILDRVLIRQDDPSEFVGKERLIIAPHDDVKEWPKTGTVIKVGPGKWNSTGTARIPIGEPDRPLVPGDRILFKRQPASALNPDEREGDPHGWYGFLMLDEENVLGIVLDDDAE